jgi:flagellar biosynthetic protein FliO
MTIKSMIGKITSIIIFLMMLPMIALAQATTEKHDISFGAALVRTGAALLFVLALIFLTVYLIKKYIPSLTGNIPISGNLKKDKIDVLSTRSLGPKKALHVVKVDGRRFLVSATDEQISLLTELKEEDQKNDLLDNNTPEE